MGHGTPLNESTDVTPSTDAAIAQDGLVASIVGEAHAQSKPVGTASAYTGPTVEVSAADRRHIRMRWSTLLATKAHELWIKGRGRRIDGQGLIGADASVVRNGFASLDDDAFDRYNLPQVWVERRQIPRVVHRRVPRHGARILDLGCGPGYSTEVLCHFADATWRITGYDLIDHSIARARRRVREGRFLTAKGERLAPEFICQSITEPLTQGGGPVPNASVDLAISGGVVGLYLKPPEARRLLLELRRVVRPGGFIALDAGPSIPAGSLRGICEQAGFAFVDTVGCVPFDPRPKLVFRLH